MLAEMTKQLKQYLELGLNPIPLRGKVANYHWKQYQFNLQDFTKPGVNVGLRTGLLPNGSWFYIVDADAKDSFYSLYKLMPQGVPIVSTGKGYHFYLTWSCAVKTRHFEGLDIITNGYCVCPPSIHASGKPYRFIAPLGPCIPELNPEKFSSPKVVHNPLAKHTQGTQALGSSQFKGVQQGLRHTTLVSLLGLLFARRYIEEDALAEIIAWNKFNCPPLGIGEVMTTVSTCWEEWDRFEG